MSNFSSAIAAQIIAGLIVGIILLMIQGEPALNTNHTTVSGAISDIPWTTRLYIFFSFTFSVIIGIISYFWLLGNIVAVYLYEYAQAFFIALLLTGLMFLFSMISFGVLNFLFFGVFDFL